MRMPVAPFLVFPKVSVVSSTRSAVQGKTNFVFSSVLVTRYHELRLNEAVSCNNNAKNTEAIRD